MKRDLKISLAVILASFAVFSGAFYWLAGEINAASADIVRQKAIISQSANLAEVLAVLKKDSVAAREYQKSLDLLVPSKDQLFLGLQNWLDGQKRLYGINMSFGFQGSEVEATADTLGRVGFGMQISGPLDSVTRFLSDLETRSPRFLMNFDFFNVTREGGAYKVTANGSVFFK